MKTLIRKIGLTSVLLALFIGCVQPPAAPNGEIETSDEAGNTVTTQAVPTNGLKGDYYDNVDFTGILKTRYDANINRTWNANAPITGIQPTTYSVRWTGQVMPAFSQTYTFFVTSSDGARLMVNGQVLVNDWVDGSSRVRSGTVALQANVKYDIRLEYYRNATNTGTVKLEWQSSSRSKQVVPKASLFPTGSNVDGLWNRAKSQLGTKLTGFTIDAENSLATFRSNGNFLIAQIQGVTKKITLYENTDGKIVYARLSDYSDSKLRIKNLIDDLEVDFGALSNYFDSNSSNDKAQNDAFLLKERLYFKIYSSSISMNGKKVTPQAVPSILCIECQSNLLEYSADAGELIQITARLEASLALAFAECIAKKDYSCIASKQQAFIIAAGFVLDLWDWKEFTDKFNIFQKTTERLVTCLSTVQCPYRLTQPTPSDISLKASTGGTASASFSVKNIGYWDMLIKESKSVAWLTLEISGVSPPINVIGVGDFRILAVNATMTVTVTAACPLSGIFTDTVTLNAKTYTIPDPDFNESRQVPIKVECGDPKISVTPNPLELVAALNSSMKGDLTVTNSGSSPVTISDISANQSWVSNVTPRNFTIAPNSSQSVTVTGVCDGAVGKKSTANIQMVGSGLSAGVASATVNLECVNSTGIFIRSADIAGFEFKASDGIVKIYNLRPISLYFDAVANGYSWLKIEGTSSAIISPNSFVKLKIVGLCSYAPNVFNAGTIEVYNQITGSLETSIGVNDHCYQTSRVGEYSFRDECGSYICLRGGARVLIPRPETGPNLSYSDLPENNKGIEKSGNNYPVQYAEAEAEARDFILGRAAALGLGTAGGDNCACIFESLASFKTRLPRDWFE